MSTFPQTTLLILLISVVQSNVIEPGSVEQNLFFYQQQILTIHQLLKADCPDLDRFKRELTDDHLKSLNLELAKLTLNRLLQTLESCRSDASKSHPVMTSSATTPEARSMSAVTEKDATKTLSIAKDCQEHYENGSATSGVYLIDPPTNNSKPLYVWCDFFDDHGWTIVQKRFDGKVDFYQNWLHYKEGFGTITGEYWLGLDNIHALSQTNWKLNILVKAANGTTKSGTWPSFIIGSEEDNYRLNVSSVAYNGSLEEFGLSFHNLMAFSTKDRDNDGFYRSCAEECYGAWWYKSCTVSNLNGGYNISSRQGTYWSDLYPLIETVMRVSRN
ncbi:microfibril-associated glycoprotein 4-like [Watersipora subatra]|uniref:microfibril-associated glycoprotein 4-like n=1 Tax=Watersipora subatra TaxID=2589382 RepID=UPI00355C8B5E